MRIYRVKLELHSMEKSNLKSIEFVGNFERKTITEESNFLYTTSTELKLYGCSIVKYERSDFTGLIDIDYKGRRVPFFKIMYDHLTHIIREDKLKNILDE